MSEASMETMALWLEADPNFRVLRRLGPFPTGLSTAELPGHHLGVLLDTETTGLDPDADEIIELAMTKFEYDEHGRILHVVDRFHGLREPAAPISEEISRLTGLTMDDLRGKLIDGNAVWSFVTDCHVVIAHNAEFDRQFCEKPYPIFEKLPWACSYDDIDWRGAGFESSKLGSILTEMGRFNGAHRAADDCDTLLYILTQPLPGADQTAFQRLLDHARKPAIRIINGNSPFSAKEKMKGAGYFWMNGERGTVKGWCKDVAPTELDAEIEWLQREIYKYPIVLPTKKITAFDRFSLRANKFP